MNVTEIGVALVLDRRLDSRCLVEIAHGLEVEVMGLVDRQVSEDEAGRHQCLDVVVQEMAILMDRLVSTVPMVQIGVHQGK